MSRHVGMMLVALSATLVVAAPVPKQLKRDDKSSIVGEWVEPADKKRTWWFKEDGTAGGGETATQRKGIYKLDQTTTPKQLDWSDDNGKTWHLGVYSLENDTLTLNVGVSPKDPRPTNFDEVERSAKVVATRKKD